MKTVTVYRPSVLENAFHDFDKYMESFFAEAPSSRFFNKQNAVGANLPAVDIRENNSAYVIEADLPGYEEKDIQVHINGGNLTIESVKETQTEENPSAEDAENKKGIYVIRERRLSSFTRSFKLPDNADLEKITAVFKNGVLSLEIKKRTESQKRTIQIEKH